MAPLKYPVGTGVSGVYALMCQDNVVYVGGSGRCMNNRMGHHICMLRHHKHSSRSLQEKWDGQSPNDFRFEVLEECPSSLVREREAHWSDFHSITLLSERREGKRWNHFDSTRVNMRKAAQQVADRPGERERRRERALRQWAEGSIGRRA